MAKQTYEVSFQIAGPLRMAIRVVADSPEQAEWLARKEYFKRRQHQNVTVSPDKRREET